jgi:hypothetical protein
MATPGQLIEGTARLFAVPENFVATPWRTLREEGVVTKSRRGPGGAHVTAADAANLLLALAGGILPLKSVLECWRTYANLPIEDRGWKETFKDIDLPHLKKLPKRHVLVDAATALLEDARHGAPVFTAQASDVAVELSGPWPQAEIRIIQGDGKNGVLAYDFLPRLAQQFRADKPKDAAAYIAPHFGGDLTQRRMFRSQTIVGIARLLDQGA